ncbi:hypothetical protein G6F31_017263 [Rhizopus arrhizus]|nr:hypothetical protein G6F31_017263 [Rhizopus arrhizus]
MRRSGRAATASPARAAGARQSLAHGTRGIARPDATGRRGWPAAPCPPHPGTAPAIRVPSCAAADTSAESSSCR